MLLGALTTTRMPDACSRESKMKMLSCSLGRVVKTRVLMVIPPDISNGRERAPSFSRNAIGADTILSEFKIPSSLKPAALGRNSARCVTWLNACYYDTVRVAGDDLPGPATRPRPARRDPRVQAGCHLFRRYPSRALRCLGAPRH